ncbi:hypothetical protein GCM10020218_080710 [Dactylosporangium vinaceum]
MRYTARSYNGYAVCRELPIHSATLRLGNARGVQAVADESMDAPPVVVGVAGVQVEPGEDRRVTAVEPTEVQRVALRVSRSSSMATIGTVPRNRQADRSCTESEKPTMYGPADVIGWPPLPP